MREGEISEALVSLTAIAGVIVGKGWSHFNSLA